MSINYNNDKELILKLRESDKKAYRFIYITYYNDLCVYLCSFTNNDYLSEDIAQDVLLKLWEKREVLNIHSSIKSYLYKSAYNAFIDSYRTKKYINKKLEALKFIGLNEAINNEDDTELIKRRLASLRTAIDELPPKCKEILLLSKIEGCKYKEISETLNVSTKTVENHMSNAFKLLRKKMLTNKFLLFFINFFIRKSSSILITK